MKKKQETKCTNSKGKEWTQKKMEDKTHEKINYMKEKEKRERSRRWMM